MSNEPCTREPTTRLASAQHRPPLLQGSRTIRSRSRRRRWIPLLVVAALMVVQTLIGAPAIAQDDPGRCAVAPSVERPGEGAVGTIDPPVGNGLAGSLYQQYGYAGFVWHTYDQGIWPMCESFDDFTTFLSNQIFNLAKFQVGVTNFLHYSIHGGNALDSLSGLDALVEEGVGAIYRGAAIPYLGFALALVAVAVLLAALRGNLAGTATAGGRVLLGLGLMATTALTPLLYVGITDSVVVEGLAELEANIYREAAPDPTVVAYDVLPTTLHENIIVTNWAIGEFGDAETPYARDTTARLVDAQAWNRDDLVTGRDADNAAEDAKKAEYIKIAEEIRGGAASFDAFSGNGSHRLGASVFALIEASAATLFQMFAKAAILLAGLLFRLAVIIGPVLGLLSMAPGVGRTIARTIGGVVVMGMVLTVGAAAHGFVITWISTTDQISTRGVKLVLIIVVSVIFWMAMRPWRRLREMAAAAVGIPAVTRDQRRLEALLHRQTKGGGVGGRLWRKVRGVGAAIDQAGGRTVETPAGWDQRPIRRPETGPILEAELVDPHHGPTPGSAVSTHRRRPRYDHDGQFWQGWAPDAPRARPELVATGTRTAGGGPDRAAPPEAGPGDGPRPGPADGTGGHGRTFRAETPATDAPVAGRGDGLPPVVPGEVIVPSQLDEQDRWRDVERTETRDTPREATTQAVFDDEEDDFRLYRPSTGRTEPDPMASHAPRPPERPETRDDLGQEDS